MIYANINTYAGMCGDAEHYYCQYIEQNSDDIPNEKRVYGGDDLKFEIKSSNFCRELNKKDTTSRWHVGMETVRFSSIEDIHDELIRKFSDKNIVTYYNSEIFKEMLIYIDGKRYGFEYLGEQFVDLPTSCYRDLVKPDCTIKCIICGKTFSLDEIFTLQSFGERDLLKNKYAHKSRFSICCDDTYLKWNVIL